MRAGRQSNPSLRWRLSWQLSLVISVVIAGVILGLCVYGTMVLSPNVAMEQEVKSAVAGAIERDRHGTLALRETPALRLLMERNDRLWFVAATTDGASLSRATQRELEGGKTRAHGVRARAPRRRRHVPREPVRT